MVEWVDCARLDYAEISSEFFSESFIKIKLDLTEISWIICFRLAKTKKNKIDKIQLCSPFKSQNVILTLYSEIPLCGVFKNGMTLEFSC